MVDMKKLYCSSKGCTNVAFARLTPLDKSATRYKFCAECSLTIIMNLVEREPGHIHERKEQRAAWLRQVGSELP